MPFTPEQVQALMAGGAPAGAVPPITGEAAALAETSPAIRRDLEQRSTVMKEIVPAAVTEGVLGMMTKGASTAGAFLPAVGRILRAAETMDADKPILGQMGRMAMRGTVGGAAQIPFDQLTPLNQGKAARTLVESFEHGAVGQGLSDGIGLVGGKAINFFTKPGFDLLVRVAPSSGSGLRTWLRKRVGGVVTEDDMTAAVFGHLMESEAKSGKLSPADMDLVKSGNLGRFIEQRLDSVIDTLGPQLDPATVARIFKAAKTKGMRAAKAPLEAIYEDITNQVGGKLVIHPDTPTMTQPLLTGPAAQPTANLGLWPSLNVKVEPGTGIVAPTRNIRAAAQEIRFRETAVADSFTEISGFVNALSKLPDDIPYRQLDAIRKDVGRTLEATKDARGFDREARGGLKRLYSVLSHERVGVLRKQGRPDLARALEATDQAYGKMLDKYDNFFLRGIASKVNPRTPGLASEAVGEIEKLSPQELSELLSIGGDGLKRAYRGHYVRDLLFSKSLGTMEEGLAGTVNATKLNKSLADPKTAGKLKVLFGNDQKSVDGLRQASHALALTQSKTFKRAVSDTLVDLNERGIVLSRIAQTPGGTALRVEIPPDVAAQVLADPYAAKTFANMVLFPAGRVARGAVTRSAGFQDTAAQFLEQASRVMQNYVGDERPSVSVD